MKIAALNKVERKVDTKHYGPPKKPNELLNRKEFRFFVVFWFQMHRVKCVWELTGLCFSLW